MFPLISKSESSSANLPNPVPYRTLHLDLIRFMHLFLFICLDDFCPSHLDFVGHDIADLRPQNLLLLLGPDSNKLAWWWRWQRRGTALVQAIKLPHFILHGLLSLGVTLTNVPKRGGHRDSETFMYCLFLQHIHTHSSLLPEYNSIGVCGLHHQHRGVLFFGDLQRRHCMVTEPPPQLLPHPQLLLTDWGVPPITVLVLSSSAFSAAPSVQDGPLGVVRHWEVDGAEVREEVKVLQDMSGQFGLWASNRTKKIKIMKG